jgi:hypothetical protein
LAFGDCFASDGARERERERETDRQTRTDEEKGRVRLLKVLRAAAAVVVPAIYESWGWLRDGDEGGGARAGLLLIASARGK